jgi:hypothetical protein
VNIVASYFAVNHVFIVVMAAVAEMYTMSTFVDDGDSYGHASDNHDAALH